MCIIDQQPLDRIQSRQLLSQALRTIPLTHIRLRTASTRIIPRARGSSSDSRRRYQIEHLLLQARQESGS